jgi:lysophospholipase L1-like esterase
MMPSSISAAPAARHRPFLLAALVLIFVALVGLAAAFIGTARYLYARELSIRLQPVVITPRRSGNPAALRVLFLGDSRAAAWPGLPPDRFLTVNAGTGGATTAQILLRADVILSNEAPSVVVLQAGINDLKAIGVLPAQAAQIQADCAANILDLVNLCLRHHARVVLSLIIPPGKVSLARRFVWSDKIEPALKDVNRSLARQFAGVENVAILDPGQVLAAANSAGDNHDDYLDTLHLTPAAYEKLQPALLDLVVKLVGPENKIAGPH